MNYEYDPNCGCSGRRTKVSDAALNETDFAYDKSGNQAAVTDANGNTTVFQYVLMSSASERVCDEDE